MIEVNYLIVAGLTVFSMALGALWYGPLFGKKWMEINGVDPNDTDAVKEMQKGMMPIYLTQLVLSLFQIWVVYHYIIGALNDMSGISNVIWIWAGFIVPTLAAAAMWTTESKRHKWNRFLIQAGYNLALFLVFGYVIAAWG